MIYSQSYTAYAWIRMYRKSSFARYKIECVIKRVCDMVTMSSVTRLRQCVTLRDRECDTAKCPPLSSLPTPAFLSSLSHNMQLCKALRKVFCNRVEIFKCCDFQGSKFVGFPSESRLHPRFVRKCGLRGSGYESVSGYSVVRAYPLHFTPLQNVSISRVLLQTLRPAHPLTSKLSTISCSLTQATLNYQTASVAKIPTECSILE